MSTRDGTHLRQDDPATTEGGTAADPPLHPGHPGPLRTALSFLRNRWRQLMSMRTALVLLFLLALASLPGALLPQWSLNSGKTAQYILDHPAVGPWLDRFGFFAVFASPWYAAIYLLLFTSLVGCLLPRTWEFVGQLRRPPVSTPRNLARLPLHRAGVIAADLEEVTARVLAGLRGRRGRRWRTTCRTEAGGVVTISAERGYLREVGNLLFHVSLLGLLVAIAIGKMFGYEGSIIINTGAGFCSAGPVSYDNFRPGSLVDGTSMQPFCVNVENFTSAYTPQGQATQFAAAIDYQSGSDVGTTSWTPRTLQVNDPLRIDGQRLYLLGHGFSPHFQVTFPGGPVRDYAQAFQPTDSSLISQGVVKITDPPGWTGLDITRHQLAIVGLFAPTAAVRNGIMTSSFPAPRNPGVAVEVYLGDLGLAQGQPQSVFAIDTRQVTMGALVKQKRGNLLPGQSITLEDGTQITFTGFNEWVSLQTSYDPAQGAALISAVTLLVGLLLSLTIKRRRVWYRLRACPVGPAEDPTAIHTLLDVGGLARTDQAGYGEEFLTLAALPGQLRATDQPRDDW